MPLLTNERKTEERKSRSQVDQLTDVIAGLLMDKAQDSMNIQMLQELSGNLLLDRAKDSDTIRDLQEMSGTLLMQIAELKGGM